MNKTLAVLLLACWSILGSTSLLQAQNVRPEQTFYVRPAVGIASYVGDNDESLLSFDDFPYLVGAEVGYQFTHPLSLGLAYQVGNYPGITPAGDADVRHTGELVLRYTFGGTTGVAPYVELGAHATFGQVMPAGLTDEETRTAFGPLLGVGLDVPLSNRISWFVEATSRAAFPDDAVDGNEDGGFGGFDLLSRLGTGLKISFESGVVAPRVLSLDGPDELEVGEVGTFTATANEQRVTRPVTYRWEWGDGSTSTGTTATHSYAAAGTYTVRFTASNRGGSDADALTVQVAEAPVSASIVRLSADPTTPDTETPVRFSATVRGDMPIVYAWDFGDGTTSSEESPVHTFGEPGTYTVMLEVRNDAGSDRRSTTVSVGRFDAAICSEVTEMNAAYFARNESILADDALRTLDENLDILLQCPDLNVRIEGHAAPGERQSQALSEDRARAVEGYYQERGMPLNRIEAEGLGAASGVTSKKDGARQYQRADTIVLE